jgi:hypothetical protein
LSLCPFVPLSLCSFRQDSLVVELPAHNRFVAGSIPAPACLFSIFGPFFPSDFPLENPLESSSGFPSVFPWKAPLENPLESSFCSSSFTPFGPRPFLLRVKKN